MLRVQLLVTILLAMSLTVTAAEDNGRRTISLDGDLATS